MNCLPRFIIQCPPLSTDRTGSSQSGVDTGGHALAGHGCAGDGIHIGAHHQSTVRSGLADELISIGDYVLTGGEIPACAIIDSIARLVPGVISDESIVGESFTMGLLEYPQYTRPYEYDGKKVPDVLVSGHHANIKKWQRYQSLKKTYEVRPELLGNIALTNEDIKMLEEIKNEKN